MTIVAIAVAGLLTGGVVAVLQAKPRNRRQYVAAALLAVVAAGFLWVGLSRT